MADLGDPRRAIPWFEGALRIRGPHDTDPPSTAEARFALASALWDTGGDRTRALSLAKAAKDTYEQLEMNRELAQVNGWLAKHGSRPPPP